MDSQQCVGAGESGVGRKRNIVQGQKGRGNMEQSQTRVGIDVRESSRITIGRADGKRMGKPGKYLNVEPGYYIYNRLSDVGNLGI